MATLTESRTKRTLAPTFDPASVKQVASTATAS